jgi:hypothetical protein
MTSTSNRNFVSLVVVLVAAVTVVDLSEAVSKPSWQQALIARSDALNRHYGLGRYAGTHRKTASSTALPPWKKALIARSDALNRRYGLGRDVRG